MDKELQGLNYQLGVFCLCTLAISKVRLVVKRGWLWSPQHLGMTASETQH